jgi:hypothetical protein
MASPAGSHEEATGNSRLIIPSKKAVQNNAPITSFFKPVSEGIHQLNVLIDQRKLLNRMKIEFINLQ